VKVASKLGQEPTGQPSTARALAFVGDENALVDGLQAGNPAARAALFDRYAHHVRRVLLRVLGPDPELADVLHDVFVEALSSVRQIEDGRLLKSWLTSVAVFTARGCIRRRTRRRWLRFVAPAALPEQEAPAVDAAIHEATRCVYAVLEQLPVDERIAFALRFVDEMELTEVAAACGVSLATIKRRLARAKRRFLEEATHHAALLEWLREDDS
jgi:RNA polymerase sigma-70 factor (ECF subfamily)